MAIFASSKSLSSLFGRERPPSGNITWALFVLLCFWAGSEIISLFSHGPGLIDRLTQTHSLSRPTIEMSPSVGLLFGVVPVVVGLLLLGSVLLVIRWRHRH